MTDVPIRFAYVSMAELPDPAYVMVERPLIHGSDPRAGIFSGAEVARSGNYAVHHDFADDSSWSITTSGDVVRVPLHRLRTPTRSPVELVQAGFMAASKALTAFMQLRLGEPCRLLVVMGNDIVDHIEPEPFYVIALGIAVIYK